MEQSGQDLANHTRWHPPFHFVLLPFLIVNMIWSGVRVWRNPEWDTMEGFLLAIALIATAVFSRFNALKAQDRLIRLEEQLRFQRVLPADLAARAIKSLDAPQYVALRFASDAELAGLVEKVLAGNPASSGDIKKAIKNWRGDYFRV